MCRGNLRGMWEQLSLCPPEKWSGASVSETERSKISARGEREWPSEIPHGVRFELTCVAMGVTVTKRWTLPSSWLERPAAAAICAAYADSLIEDLRGLEIQRCEK